MDKAINTSREKIYSLVETEQGEAERELVTVESIDPMRLQTDTSLSPWKTPPLISLHPVYSLSSQLLIICVKLTEQNIVIS